jgi:diacylglycerol kinase
MGWSSFPQRSHRKFIAGFGHAFRGLWYALCTQRHVRIHILAAILAVTLGIILRISALEFAIIFIAITGVFTTEMLNTVAELCVDLASLQYHPLAKIAKDVAAGAVLANAILAIVIGGFVFVPHIIAFF